MNDDIENGEAGGSRKRTAAVAAVVGVAGLVAGGLAAGAISAASASTDSSATGQAGYGAPRGYGGPGSGGQNTDPSKPMRGDEKLLTGTTKTKVLAAVKAKYPNATVQRAETDSDGVYEAHILNAGKPLIVQVGKDFTITGTQTGHSGKGGGHGGRPPGSAEGSTSRTS